MAINSKSPRIGTLRNLGEGGTYDLLMIEFADGFPNSQLLFNIKDTPAKVTGVQKVAQTFLKILLTTKGSDVIHPNTGTEFPSLVINANRTADQTVLYAELGSAIRDAEGQVKRIMNTSRDPASRLRSIDILGMEVGEESALMYLSMTTDDGETSQVAIPFPEFSVNG